MDIKVTRHSFFRGKVQHERFTEHAPLCAEDPSHDICNCTKTVTERPVGEPEQVSQIVDYMTVLGKYRMRLEMVAGSGVKFWIHWPRAEGKPKRPFDNNNDEHAYFWWGGDHLKVEVTGTGDNGDVDCTLGDVYFGNAVDVSTFFNGHSSSRIVKLSELLPDDVWTHHCTFGNEAWTKLSSAAHAAALWLFRQKSRAIHDWVSEHNTFDRTVEDVRVRCVEDVAANKLIEDCFAYLVGVLDGFQESALRRDIVKVCEEATSAMLARSKRERGSDGDHDNSP